MPILILVFYSEVYLNFSYSNPNKNLALHSFFIFFFNIDKWIKQIKKSEVKAYSKWYEFINIIDSNINNFILSAWIVIIID